MLIIFGALAGGLYWFTSRVIRAKKVQKILKEAYFDGGPLDGETHKLKTLPNEYMFGDAVYRHDGGGMYHFEDYLHDGTDRVQDIAGWKS